MKEEFADRPDGPISFDDDPAMREMRRRDMGGKMLDLFNVQYAAAAVLANASIDSRVSYASANATRYTSFTSSKTAIETAIKTKLDDGSKDSSFGGGTTGDPIWELSNYLRSEFFDKYVFPSMVDMGAPPPPGPLSLLAASDLPPINDGFMDDMVSRYGTGAEARIMVYFMGFFAGGKGALFNSMINSMQPIFTAQFSDPTASYGGQIYYMGPAFWATNPAPSVVKARNDAFKAALDNAVDTAVGTAFNIFSNAAAVKAAFKTLSAPPNMI